VRLLIAAVGRLKDGPDRALYERYAGRIDAAGRSVALGPLTLAEIPESRAADAGRRRQEEAERLRAAARSADILVALDEAGKGRSSTDFARWLATLRDGGTATLAFAIGGPDGHGADLLEAARARLSLGPMTLPHGLARVVLSEQLYRAATILAGHPYHRG
jgi:23S rRNA (pseudouridine1915-N3)-methyltransferase